MKLYRFSPIENEKSLSEAVVYTAQKASDLCKEIIGKRLPISSLTIFSHYSDEYERLVSIANEIGEPLNENNGPRVTLYDSIGEGENVIKELRIRQPDPYRTQVGCNDFEVDDYLTFKKEFLEKHPKHLRLIVREEYEMIEFHHPDYDVFAYIVSDGGCG